MTTIQLAPIDYAVLAVYFLFVIGIGWALRRFMRSSTDFFLTWGVVLIVFGAVNLYLGRTGTSTARLAEEVPEGRAIEAMEQRTGKEGVEPADG